MTTSKDERNDGGRDEIVAGEYVLGVLPDAARRAAAARIARDPDFAARVERWESDLASFNSEYEEAKPPRAVFSAVESRLFPQDGKAQPVAGAPGGLWNSLTFWRGLTLASFLVVAGMAATVVYVAKAPLSGQPLVADLTAKHSPIGLVAYYDKGNGTLKLTPVAAKAQQPKSLELWMINGKQAPVSLGLVPQNGRGEVVIPADKRQQFGAGTVLAISLEPQGGSPSGQPTGPVIAAGPARSL